jgi:6-phosphogluconolactonase (cycloisomerase 2 family)
VAALLVGVLGAVTPATASAALQQLPGLAGCTSSLGGDGLGGTCVTGRALDEVQALATSSDGKNVYAATAQRTDTFGTNSTNGIAVFSRDPATGALTQLPGTAGCVTDDGSGGACTDGRALVDTRGVAVSPDGMHVYAAAGGAGGLGESGSIVAFSRNPTTGALTQLATTDGCLTLASGPGGVGGGPDGCGGVRGLSMANSIAVTNTSVYVTSSKETVGSESLVVLSRNPMTGVLTQLNTTDGCISDTGADGLSGTTCTDGRAMYEPKDVVVSKDGANVYVAVSEATAPPPHGPGAVAVFGRDSTGKLTQLTGALGCLSKASGETCADARGLRDATSISMSPDDQNVYVAAQGNAPVTGPGTVVVLTRDLGNGTLTQPAGTRGCLTADGTDGTGPGGTVGDCATVSTGFAEPTDVTISPDGNTAYVATSDDHTITAFTRAGDGSLSPVGGADGCVRHAGGGGCAAGRALEGASSIVVFPNCGDAYVAGTSGVPSDPSIAAFATCRPVATATVATCSQSGDVPVGVTTPTAGRSAAAVRFRIDGGAEQRMAVAGGAATVNVPEGAHSLEYWGEDTAGTQGADHSTVTVLVDHTGPSVTIASGQGKTSYQVGERATVNISAGDEISGLTTDPSARDVVVATDRTGTFSVSREGVDACGNRTTATFTYSVATACTDRLSPVTKLTKSGVVATRQDLRLSGRSADRGAPCPSGLKKVQVSLAKVSGRTGVNCRFVKSRTSFALTGRRNCRRPVLFTASGTTRWQFAFDLKLPPGLYRAQARALDVAGNKETPKKGRNIVFFEVR